MKMTDFLSLLMLSLSLFLLHSSQCRSSVRAPPLDGCVQSEVGGAVMKGCVQLDVGGATQLSVTFQDSQAALQQLKVSLQVIGAGSDSQVNQSGLYLHRFETTFSFGCVGPVLIPRYLGMFQLQLCQLHQVLPESSHSSRFEVYELCVQNTVSRQRSELQQTDTQSGDMGTTDGSDQREQPTNRVCPD